MSASEKYKRLPDPSAIVAETKKTAKYEARIHQEMLYLYQRLFEQDPRYQAIRALHRDKSMKRAQHMLENRWAELEPFSDSVTFKELSPVSYVKKILQDPNYTITLFEPQNREFVATNINHIYASALREGFRNSMTIIDRGKKLILSTSIFCDTESEDPRIILDVGSIINLSARIDERIRDAKMKLWEDQFIWNNPTDYLLSVAQLDLDRDSEQMVDSDMRRVFEEYQVS